MIIAVLKVLLSKGTALTFALFYTSLVILGSTFSWITSSEQKANEFTGKLGLKTVIVEDFTTQTQWQPNTEVVKKVSVYNEGESAGFVRISFEEIVKMLNRSTVSEPFADSAEAGITPEYCLDTDWIKWQDASDLFDSVEFREGETIITPVGVKIKVQTSPAGTQRNKYAIYQVLDDGQSYRRMTAGFSVQGNILTVLNPRYWGYPNTWQETEAAWGLANKTTAPVTPPNAADITHLVCDTGKKITINYANMITALTGTSTDTNKWYYNEEDGFFYYINKINSFQTSSTLMTGLSLGADADNIYSNMNLQFIVNLQALQVNASALQSDWGISSSSALYQALVAFAG